MENRVLRGVAILALCLVGGVTTVGMSLTVEFGGAVLIPLLIATALGVLCLAYPPPELQHERPAVCLRCTYDLTGLPRRARCPECGHPYDLDAHREPPAAPMSPRP